MPRFNGNRMLRQEARKPQKVPYTKKRTTNGVKLSPDVIKQKRARGYFESMKSRLSLKAVREIGTGVDFVHNFFRGKERFTTRFDLKFSYGQLGDHVIKVRLLKRRLLNNADWAMAVGRNKEIEFFPIKALDEYIKRNYGTISKNIINKGTYSESAVSLTDLYAKMRITPIRATLRLESIAQALEKIAQIQHPPKKQPKPVGNTKPKRGSMSIPKEKQIRFGKTNGSTPKVSVQSNKPNGFFIPRPTQRHK